MKKFILHILLFFAIVAVIDLCVGFTGDYLQAHAKSGDTRKTNGLVMNDNHDILVFGSSRACHHYDTPFLSDTLGLDVYNAGYDGNGVVLAYGLFDMILERYQPKLVVLDVEPAFDINFYSADNGHLRYIGLLKPYYRHTGAEEVIRDVSEEEWYKCFSGMMRYNTTIISKALDNVRIEASDNKGFLPLAGSYVSETPKKDKTKTNVDSFKVAYFERMLLLAQSKTVPIMVVASPKLGVDSSASLQPVIELCKKHDVPFFDYYTDAEFIQHKEWFKESMHLNNVGARFFSGKLLYDIKDLFPL